MITTNPASWMKKDFLASDQCTIRKKRGTMGRNRQASPHQILARNAATKNNRPPIRKMMIPRRIITDPIFLSGVVCSLEIQDIGVNEEANIVEFNSAWVAPFNWAQ
jgi:hypothetical protein